MGLPVIGAVSNMENFVTRNLLILLSVLAISGCSIHKEGISIGGTGNKFSVIDLEKCETAGCPEKVLLIGTVSALRKIDDHSSTYEDYIETSKKFVTQDRLSLDLGQFTEEVGGWTLIQTFNIPLVGANYKSTFIPKEVLADITYPSTAETFLVQGTGDLVVASSNEDGLFLIEKLLCKVGEDFKICKSLYRRGIFDATTGKELDKKYLVLPLGKKIDVETYKQNTNKKQNGLDDSVEPRT